jgi:hypothetical protein
MFDECAILADVMNDIPPQLRILVEAAVADGLGMDDIEHEVIDPANLAPEDHDAVWLYALARLHHPQRRRITIISG